MGQTGYILLEEAIVSQKWEKIVWVILSELDLGVLDQKDAAKVTYRERIKQISPSIDDYQYAVHIPGYEYKCTVLDYALLNFADIYLEKLELVLMLGANPTNGLHKYLSLIHKYETKPNLDVLRLFSTYGADIHKPNQSGKSASEQAYSLPFIAFLKFMETIPEDHPQSDEAKAALKLQRFYRKYRYRKSISPHQFFPPRDETAIKTIADKHHFLSATPPTPTEDHSITDDIKKSWLNSQEDKVEGQNVLNQINYITYDEFHAKLQLSIEMFNTYIMSMPEKNKGYIIILDDSGDKSISWVTSLALKHLACIPHQVIKISELTDFTNETKIKQFLIIDDAAYSGNQISGTMKKIHKTTNNNINMLGSEFSLVIPFMTIKARLALQNLPIHLFHCKTLPAFRRLGNKYHGATVSFFQHKMPEAGISTVSSFGIKIRPPYKQKTSL